MHLGQHIGQHDGAHFADVGAGIILPTVPALPKHVRIVNTAAALTIDGPATVEVVHTAAAVAISEVSHG